MKRLLLALSFVLLVFTAAAQRSMWWGATKRPGGGAWTPASISGLVHWYDAQDIVGKNNGDEVTTWNNKVGGSTNMVGQTGSSPTYIASDSKFGNKPTLMFPNGITMRGSNVASSARTIFVVGTCTNSSTQEGYMVIAPSGGNAFIFTQATNLCFYYFSPQEAYDHNDSHKVNAVSTAGVARYTDVSTLDLKINGASAWNRINPDDGYTNSGDMVFGWIANATVWIGAVLVYDGALSDSNVNLVGNYLATRWNFTWTNL